LPLSDPKSKAGRLFTNAELSALWDAMSEDMRDQFVLAFECFMRLREALLLTWDRIDLNTGKLTLRAEDVKTGSKTGKGRSFFVSPNALTRLRAKYANQVEPSPYVFPAPGLPDQPRNQNKNAWTSVKRKAGIKGRARWHDIRHTSLTKALLEQELNAAQVSEYAGVSLRTIQRVYLHSNEELTKNVANALSIARISRDQKA
jgi:integrase